MIGRSLPFVMGAIGAAGFSQFPEYSQQYTQRLGGAYEEVRVIAEQFRTDATNSGKTIDEALATYAASGDGFLADRGLSMRQVLDREAALADQLLALENPAGFNRLVSFVAARDDRIVADTMADYRPAVPLTFEGLAHAALGFLLGYFILRLPGMIFRRRGRARA